jgi:hypothetical protein
MKRCKFNFRLRCYHSSCDLFDRNSGNVFLCVHFLGGDFFTSRKVGVGLVPLFSRHLGVSK